MKVDTGALALLLQEASALSNKSNWSKQDERRNAYLLAAISAVKSGASLEELDQNEHNAAERRAGLPVTNFKRGLLTSEQRSVAKQWKTVVETRDMTEGAPMLSHIGTYSGLGTFVPTDFYPSLFSAMKAHDPLFDGENVTLIQSTNGRDDRPNAWRYRQRCTGHRRSGAGLEHGHCERRASSSRGIHLPDRFVARCECGEHVEVFRSSLITGTVKKCGRCTYTGKAIKFNGHIRLYKKRDGSAASRTSREYNTWKNMMQRAHWGTGSDWENYKGRGIRVCDRWTLPKGYGFRNFLSDMGPRPAGMTLDRKDVQGHYTPENCKWSDIEEQQTNRRCVLFADGEEPPVQPLDDFSVDKAFEPDKAFELEAAW